jgi:hypothetical protein
MARYNERNTRQSRFSEDEEPRSTYRKPTASGRGSGRGRQQQQQPTVEYFPIFSLFGNEQRDGRLQVDIKCYDGKNGSIEDHLTVEEFLFFCEKLYYGEPLEGDDYGVKLVGSLWEMDNPTKESTHSGNIRFSSEKLQAIKDEYAASVGGSKKKTNKAEPKAAARKPKYEVPEEEEEEEYEEVEVVLEKKKRTPVKPAVVLDMAVEEVETLYGGFTQTKKTNESNCFVRLQKFRKG